MFEQINTMTNKDQEYNFSTEKTINRVIQYIIDGYLRRKEQPLMKDLLAESNIEEKDGILYNWHISLLQMMFAEELLLVGINLSEEVEKSGEKFELGKLSKLEENYLNNKIENVVGLLDIIKEKISK